MRLLLQLLIVGSAFFCSICIGAVTQETEQPPRDSVIHVLPLFTPDAFEFAGRDFATCTELAAGDIARGREVLHNSGVSSVTLQLADLNGMVARDLVYKKVPGPDDMLKELCAIAECPEEMERLRKKAGADIVVLYTKEPIRNDGAIAVGLSIGVQLRNVSWADGRQMPLYSEKNRVLCSRVDLARYSSFSTTFIHELGHLVGCGHSDIQGGAQGSGSDSGPQTFPDSCGLHGCSQRGVKYRTVMAYDHTSSDHGPFLLTSRPTFSRPGTDTIVQTGETVQVGDAERHNNARIFQEFGPYVAGVEIAHRALKNDMFAQAQAISAQDEIPADGAKLFAVFGDTAKATTEDGDPVLSGENGVAINCGRTLWYCFAAQEDGTLVCGFAGTDAPTLAIVMKGDGQVASLQRYGLAVGSSGQDVPDELRLSAPLALHAGEKVYICVDGIREGNVQQVGYFELRVLFKKNQGSTAPTPQPEPTPQPAEPDAPQPRPDEPDAPQPRQEAPPSGAEVEVFNVILAAFGLFSLLGSLVLFMLGRSTRSGGKKPQPPYEYLRPEPPSDDTVVTLIYPGGRSETHPLTRSETVLGRDADCGIVITDSSVSGKHACIRRNNDRWEIKDLGSTNGTIIVSDGTVLHCNECAPISLQDTIGLGNVHLRIHH